MKIFLLGLGLFEHMVSLANSLSKFGKIVLMYPENDISSKEVELISRDVKFIPFNFPRMKSPESIFLIKEIVDSIIKHDPDIVHIQSGGHPWFFMALPFIKKYPLITTIHDPKRHSGEEHLGKTLSQDIAVTNSDHFIVFGEKVKQDMIDIYRIPENRIDVIPLGSQKIYKEWQIKSYDVVPNTLLFFGRIFHYKGLAYLIKAEPLISEKIPDLKIVIAGRGDNFSKYEKLMVNKDRFIVKNYRISNEEITELFQKTSVVVLPYVEATQSGVVPLAYAFGTPVIATNVGSIPESVQHGVTGLIVPPKDVRSLAAAAIKLLEDNNLRLKMGQNAYKKSEVDLSWNQLAKQYMASYRTAVQYRS